MLSASPRDADRPILATTGGAAGGFDEPGRRLAAGGRRGELVVVPLRYLHAVAEAGPHEKETVHVGAGDQGMHDPVLPAGQGPGAFRSLMSTSDTGEPGSGLRLRATACQPQL